MKKRGLSILLAAMMTALTLAGCGGGGGGTSTTGGSAAGGADTGAADTSSGGGEVLHMMISGNVADAQTQGYQKIVDAFNADNEWGVTIELESVKNADYKTKLTTLMASDAQPAIISTWELGYLENFVNGGKIVNLQPYLDADPEWAGRFNDGVLDLLTYDGDCYGIPTQQSAGVMYYNKRIFEENNVSVPTTYEEYLQVCETLKANGVVPVALASRASDAWLVSQYIQELANGLGGYDVFQSLRDGTGTWNNEHFVEAGRRFQAEIENGYFEDGFTGVTGDEARELFRTGGAAMYYNGSWETSNVGDPNNAPEAENISCFTMPVADPANRGISMGSVDTSLAITVNCTNVDAAVGFLKYWTNAENAAMLAYDYGRLPCTRVELDESRLTPLVSDLLALFGDLKNVTPWLDRMDADLGNEFNNTGVAIANGDDPQEAFDALQQYVESR